MKETKISESTHSITQGNFPMLESQVFCDQYISKKLSLHKYFLGTLRAKTKQIEDLAWIILV